MSYILYDAVIGIVLLLFALRGRKRGLVLSICSLAAVITAFAGASYAADILTPKAAEVVVPKISSVIEARIRDLDLDLTGSHPAQDDPAPAEGGADDGTAGSDGAETSGAAGAAAEAVREALGALKLPAGLMDSVEDGLGSLKDLRDLPALLSAAIARAAADTLLHLVIFLICFVLILLLWRLIGHALDLVARLPVLHFFNKTGGFLFGLCKGAFVLFLAAWLLRTVGNIVPADAVEQTRLLRFFMTVNPLTYITGM